MFYEILKFTKYLNESVVFKEIAYSVAKIPYFNKIFTKFEKAR